MLQSFAASTSPDQGPPRLAALRAALSQDGLNGFLVPRADAHQGEYVAPCDERLAWLTGFTGSAGFCAVLDGVAGVFVDGRYRVQARAQVAPEFTPVNWPETTLADWLIAHLPEGGVVGFDPWLHTVDEVQRLREKLGPKEIELRAIPNPLDHIWKDRPAPPGAPFTVWPFENAGESHDDKRARIAATLREAGHKAAILTLPDSVAWLLNIRGTDIARNPVPQAFAILHEDARCDLFALPGKADALREYLGDQVTVLPQDGFLAALTFLSGPVRLDHKTAPYLLLETLNEGGVKVAPGDDPCILPKARKNAAEIAGTRAAHLRDGAAMVRFLAWLDAEAPNGGLTEIDVVKALEGFRRDTNALRDISFETICGAGPHGAIVHYRVTEDTNSPVAPDMLLLVDSGGQYIDGTTDITRTVLVGRATDEQRACYTRVLQGMIAISRARFPKGLAGRDLDALARYPLWTQGRDYDHGTGHGVGVYLSVHEGPQRLSRISEVPFEPGMILSNEPGYYREGAFGIRIENLIVVQDAPALAGADDRTMLAFETLTWVPLDRRLVDTALLSPQERDWIDAYHAETRGRIGPRVDGQARRWLEQACAPLDEG